MKKGLINSYLDGIIDNERGESYTTILRYFFPEFITAFMLYSLPFWLDAYFIANLKSTCLYSTLGATNNLLHMLTKVGEALSIGSIIMTGRFNGRASYKDVGRTVRDSFWVSIVLGAVIAAGLYFGAPAIYRWYVPVEMIAHGVPFMRLRAVGIFLMFIFMALIGFLRGVKNTQAPMAIFILGTVTFVITDFILIFGKFGCPSMGLQGSAIASIVQYAVMLGVVIIYILYNPCYRKYGISLFSRLGSASYWKELVVLSAPICLDKAAMALAYIWLCARVKSLGTCGVAAFCVVKDLERFALLPALALAQVVTFLVSNDMGEKNWDGIKSNIKKIVILACVLVGSVLLITSMFPHYFVRLFDSQGEFTTLASRVFPLLSGFVFFDLLQVVLSGALRGSANVYVVMLARVLVCSVYFVPASLFVAWLPIQDTAIKLVLLYGSYYIGNGIMSLVYIYYLRGESWKSPQLAIKDPA